MTTTAAKGVHLITVPTPFQVGPVNLYVLQNSNGLTLVDTGPMTPEAEAALTEGLAEIGAGFQDIKQVVLTHSHCDHVGLLERIAAAGGAKVYAHPLTDDILREEPAFIQHRKDFFYDLYHKLGLDDELRDEALQDLLGYQDYMGRAGVDVKLQEGDVIPGHEEWQVVYTPGHAQDHISLYRAEDGVMILGDHLIRHISSNAFIEPPPRAGEERPQTLLMYREALLKVRELDWHTGFTGHGEPVTGHRELIDKRLASQAKRRGVVEELVRSGKATCLEIAREMFPRYLNQMPLILSETLGHLDWLTADGVVEREEVGGVWHYRVKEQV